MLVYLIAIVEVLFYMLSVPVNLAVRVQGLRAGTGVAAFDGHAARRRAGRALRAEGESGGRKPGFRAVWLVLRRVALSFGVCSGRGRGKLCWRYCVK